MTQLANSPAARDIANVLHPYTNLARHEEIGPRIIDQGKGVYVYDDAGKEYIEGMAGLWSTSLGFGEPELVDAAVEQLKKLPYYHIFTHKSTNPSIDLAEKLKALAPAEFSKVFFANSGSEANDTLIKLLWYYNNALGRPEKKKIISRVKAYHGVTIASASLTGLPANHADFDLPIAGILHADCPHHYRFAEPGETEEEFATRLAANLEKLILDEGPETIAGFIAEPIMGAGGVIVPPATYFEKVQAVLTKYGIKFCVDEVICGFARTGNYWGSQTFNIKPDFLTCAKALSSSYLPISALMVPEDVFAAMQDQSRKIGTFGHGYTYSGHPVAAAVANKTLEIYEKRNIVDHVRAVSPRFQARLKALGNHPLVGEARGVGLIGAVELVANKAEKTPFNPPMVVGTHCFQRAEVHGLVVRNIVDSVAICPPLVISESEIDDLFDRLEKALDDTEMFVAAEGLRG